MAYATLDDLILRYGRDEIAAATPDRNAPRGELDETRVQQALNDASALMESTLQRRYQLPITPVTPILVRICCQLARYDLATGGDNIPSEQIRTGKQEALNWLSDVMTGAATLDVQLVNETSQSWSRIALRNAGIKVNTLW